jgi:hypothetical protein
MANAACINDLVLKVRQRADQINSTTYDDATELKPWLRDSLSQLYEILVSRWQDYYTVARPISLIAGQLAYSLPADFRALDSVWMLYNAGQARTQLEQFEQDELDQLCMPKSFSSFANAPCKYRVIRNLLYILPAYGIDVRNAIEIFYVPQYQKPLLDYTSLDDVLPNGWDEWIVLDMLEKMAVKTRLIDVASVGNSKSQMQTRLLAAASIRTGTAPRMRDATRPKTIWGGPSSPSGPAYWSAA